MSRGCGWAKVSACRLQVSLFCAVLCQIVSLQYLSRSSLYPLADLPCPILLSYGFHVVTCEVYRSCLRRLIALFIEKLKLQIFGVGIDIRTYKYIIKLCILYTCIYTVLYLNTLVAYMCNIIYSYSQYI